MCICNSHLCKACSYVLSTLGSTSPFLSGERLGGKAGADAYSKTLAQILSFVKSRPTTPVFSQPGHEGILTIKDRGREDTARAAKFAGGAYSYAVVLFVCCTYKQFPFHCIYKQFARECRFHTAHVFSFAFVACYSTESFRNGRPDMLHSQACAFCIKGLSSCQGCPGVLCLMNSMVVCAAC